MAEEIVRGDLDLPVLPDGNGRLPEGLEGLRAFARAHFGGDAREVHSELSQEFAALFIGPRPRTVHPYESVYREPGSEDGTTKPGLAWGECTAAVSRAYAQAGAQMSEETKELPDFIGLEQGFIWFLCEREAQASGGENQEEVYRYRTPRRSS